MFTGIVRGAFPVERIVRTQNAMSYSVGLPDVLLAGLERGASVAIDGVCQTVALIEGSRVRFDANDETLRVTTLGELAEGSLVHVERSARQGDENGGHVLSGHVDGTADIAAVERTADNLALVVRVPSGLGKYVFNKGFIALQGASLTVNGWDGQTNTFRVHLIPETLRLTTFGEKRIGDRVNLEIDRQTQIIVDTIERAVARALEGRGPL
ncbi:MAG: riboflavin synthase subunit alpha [Polyangiaceae bacterium]|jgi:riboflavin synthase